MEFTQKRFLFVVLVLFFPLYFLCLRSLPVYQIPENAEVKLRGRIARQPYLKDSYQVIYLGPVLIKTNRFPSYFYHQKIEVIGKFERRVINRFQTYYSAYFPAIRVIEQEENGAKKFNLPAALIRFRGRVEKAVGELLPEPQLSLLLGIVFGAKRQMPREFWQSLQKTGTLHIVVASGQNLSLVAWFLVEALVWVMTRRKALAIALVGVILYVLMVGAEAPVVRAGIMATVAYTAQFWGREEDGTIALVLAAAMMLLISPLILFDIGFQLSFAATAGIIWIYPLLVGDGVQSPPAEILVSTSDSLAKKRLRLNKVIVARKVKSHKIWQASRALSVFRIPVFGGALATTIAAQLAVMPIILVNFGQMSPFSPLVNGVVLWVVPLVMVLGGVVVSLALVIRPLAQVLAWFVWMLLTYFVKVIEVSGKLPWGFLELGELSAWWALGYYGMLTLAIYYIKLKTKNKKPKTSFDPELKTEGHT